jgi:hypothetical protein
MSIGSEIENVDVLSRTFRHTVVSDLAYIKLKYPELFDNIIKNVYDNHEMYTCQSVRYKKLTKSHTTSPYTVIQGWVRVSLSPTQWFGYEIYQCYYKIYSECINFDIDSKREYSQLKKEEKEICYQHYRNIKLFDYLDRDIQRTVLWLILRLYWIVY